jgi:16S rRNA processing protein RimM
MDEAYVVIGRIVRPHALKGEVVVESLSDFPDRFAALETVVLLGREADGTAADAPADPAPREVRVTGVKQHRQGAILALEGVTTPEGATALRGTLIGVPRGEAVPLEPGEYYAFQLVGLEVVTTTGESLGRLREVLHYPANDVYEVWDEGRGREVLLPATAEVIRQVDLERGVMIVQLLDGLVEP